MQRNKLPQTSALRWLFIWYNKTSISPMHNRVAMTHCMTLMCDMLPIYGFHSIVIFNNTEHYFRII